VLRTLQRVRVGGDSRTHIARSMAPVATESAPIGWWTVTDCAPSIDPRNRLSAAREVTHSKSQPETCDGLPSRTLLKKSPPMVCKTECNLPVSMLQAVAMDS